MKFCQIERELGQPTVEAVLIAALSVISEDPDDAGYAGRLTALQSLLVTTLALTALRSGQPAEDLADELAREVREAVFGLRRRDVAKRETGVLADVPADWRSSLAPRQGLSKRFATTG